MYRIFVSVILLLVSFKAFSVDDGFYGFGNSDCSKRFIKLDLKVGRYITFYQNDKGYSFKTDSANIDENGKLNLHIGFFSYFGEEVEPDVYQMYAMHEERKIQHSDRFSKCQKFSDERLAVFNELLELSNKYPGVSFGIGHEGLE